MRRTDELIRFVAAAAIAGVIFAGPLGAAPRDIEIYHPPTGPLSLHAPDEKGGLYGSATGKAQWHVSQWNTPGQKLADFQSDEAVTQAMSVREMPAGYRIRQGGQTLPCRIGSADREFDGFIGVNTRASNPSLPTAEAQSGPIPLSSLSNLIIKAKLTAASGMLPQRADACRENKGVSTIALVLSNPTRRTTLFYQIILHRLHTATSSPFWWAKGQGGRYGFNEVVESFGEQAVPDGGTKTYSLDVAARIRQILMMPIPGLDPDPSHWTISGAYFGNSIWGDVQIDTTWSDISFTGRLN